VVVNYASSKAGTESVVAAITKAGGKAVAVGGDITRQLAYTLTAGLNLGQPYTVPGYPTGINPITGLNCETLLELAMRLD
jgi:hypothetical protein